MNNRSYDSFFGKESNLEELYHICASAFCRLDTPGLLLAMISEVFPHECYCPCHACHGCIVKTLRRLEGSMRIFIVNSSDRSNLYWHQLCRKFVSHCYRCSLFHCWEPKIHRCIDVGQTMSIEGLTSKFSCGLAQANGCWHRRQCGRSIQYFVAKPEVLPLVSSSLTRKIHRHPKVMCHMVDRKLQ